MRSRLAIALAASLAALLLAPGAARAQDRDRLVLALYAPSISFKDTDARLSYLKLLADAISANVGRKVEPRLYGSLAQLTKAAPDFAIVEPQCAIGSPGWPALAVARIGGKQARRWALYGAQGQSVSSLRGKRLAYAAAGCRDKEFLENVLFGSEVKLRYFGATSAKTTVTGAVAEVSSVRAAEAVFAPEPQAGGLSKLFDAGEVPNPVLVVVNPRLNKAVVDAVEQAAEQFSTTGAIDGWARADRRAQADLARRMQGVSRRYVFAEPGGTGLPIKSLLQDTKANSATVPVRRYFDVGEQR